MERIFSKADISNAAYTVVLILVLIFLATPRLSRIKFLGILTVSLFFFLIYKYWIGELTISQIPVIVVFEIMSVVITTLLAYWLGQAFSEFEHAVTKISIGHHDRLPVSDSIGQGLIYREVRRARNHQRPLALITIGVNERTLKLTFDRMIQEVQLAMMKQYKLSELSRILCKELEDCAIIIQQEDQFVIALPETKPEEVPVIVERLRKKADDQVGVKLEIGTATLPNDGFTFEGLIDKASTEMKSSQQAQSLIDFDRVPSEHPVAATK